MAGLGTALIGSVSIPRHYSIRVSCGLVANFRRLSRESKVDLRYKLDMYGHLLIEICNFAHTKSSWKCHADEIRAGEDTLESLFLVQLPGLTDTNLLIGG